MRRRLDLAIVALFVVAVLAGCGPPSPTLPLATIAAPTATAAPPAPTATPAEVVSVPENLSAGDPYSPELGNRGYDVRRYTLRLALDPSVAFVDGQAVIEASSTSDRLDQVSLDLVGFEVSEVSLSDSSAEAVPLFFFRQQGKLVVNLPEPLSNGMPFSLKVVYSGEPVQEASIYVPFVSHLGLHFQPDENNLFVVAEPDGARYWFPVNDHPRDKAAFRFELVVPEGLTGVANGVLVEVQTGLAEAFPDGRPGDRYVWEHDQPLASAFATVAVGQYQRLESTSPQGVLLRHYVYPERQYELERFTVSIGQMIDWMSDLFGPYPFEAFGYVTVSGIGASLETQTMVILSAGAIYDETTLVHEMAHMWFGDWVSLDSWGDMWRSEGFATYVSLMWQTRNDPQELERIIEEAQVALDLGESSYPLNHPPPEELFGHESYVKGAVVAHALRQEMGDEAFFGGLRAYFEQYGGGTATHAQFQAVLEEAAGLSLDDFFEEWFK